MAPIPKKKFKLSCLSGGRSLSKFEEKGKQFQDDLLALQDQGESPIHWYQIDAVLRTHALLRGTFLQTPSNNTPTPPVLIVAPTGSGKSGMIFMLPYVLQSRKVLILTPSLTISEQLGATFGLQNQTCFLEKVGLCSNPAELTGFLENGRIIRSWSEIKPDKLLNLVIVNAQKFGGASTTTLSKKESKRDSKKFKPSLIYRKQEIVKDVEKFFEQFDTLIVDEAHHYPAETWANIVNAFQKQVSGMTKQIIFLTATPTRTMPDGSTQDILPTQRIAFQITPQTLEGKTIRKMDFIEQTDISQLATHIRKQLAVNSKLESRIKHQVMILVRTKKEAEDCAENLNKAIRPHYAVPIVSDRVRVKEETEAFNNGEFTVAVTCGLLKEGYDNSSVSVCVILRNVQSKILFSQFIGRCMRKKRFGDGQDPDKTLGVVLSYKKYGQQKMWEEREALAKEDPIEVEDD